MNEHTDMMPVIGSRRSHSYLLRLWQEAPGTPWRAMLRSVMTQEEHLFPDLEGLITFLKTGMGEAVTPVEHQPRRKMSRAD